MQDNKIQTGLRIPEALYNELKAMADNSGVSLNALILMLVDIGLMAITYGIEQAAKTAPAAECTGE